MEDGSDGLSSETPNTQTLKNGEVMAKLPEPDIPDVSKGRPESPAKVNGNSNANENTFEEECDSSDCDALVIDESVRSYRSRKNESRTSKCGGFKGFKKTSASESFLHSNPYFSESIFDLLEKSQEKKPEHFVEKNPSDKKTNCKNNLKSADKKVKSNPKLREYAQYLGLQPTVQFKCSKCSRAGFQSLQSLNEHLLQCDNSTPVNNLTNSSAPNAPSTNIRVTRKVFLCSACGTYYENWNLFLHMREVHKRYICLYCLGMFSHPDKLSLHIVSKHNCVPNHINSIEEFFNTHKEPCFLMCCECQKGFTERDNFFDHTCIDNSYSSKVSSNSKQTKVAKQKNVEHVTADSVDSSKASMVEENKNYLNKDTIKLDNVSDEKEDNDIVNNSEDMKIDTSEDKEKDDEIKEKTTKVDSENNSLMSKLTTSNLDNDQKSIETPFCDNKETDDVNESSNNSEESTQKRTESNSEEEEEEEEEVTRQDDSLSRDHPNSDDLNDSLDMSTTEDPEIETAQDSNATQEKENQSDAEMETRKVPKVTLKLPKSFDYAEDENEDETLAYESDDSENLTMEVDQIENESEPVAAEETDASLRPTNENQFQVAGPEVPIIELELEQPLDKFDIRILLQKCLRTTISTCIFCNHARRISVNGKQLGLHAIAEHRFSAVVNSITAEELIPESFVARIKDGLTELENVYFNLETNLPDEAITFSHVFECFQCRYSTTIHKELYLHNRKMHAKSILLCIMCKSNFYSYSELICHLCPGVYELERDVQFRCCMCVSDDLPSAFRLMVHLRKRHHACDVCLELCHNQSKLSNHVWKHKLHHLCYRCGIAYRNKPDITKHLYWKHGTESVTCKKCLQKKWPHVYHFCIPPLSFSCEECNLSFSRAVSLMVHKRFHKDERPHACQEEGCEEKFVSKKLLLKHEFKHREPPEEPIKIEPENTQELETTQPPSSDAQNQPDENATPAENEEKTEKPKPKVDVYDLPELNLSESDSSESDDEKSSKNKNDADSNEKSESQSGNESKDKEAMEIEKPPPVMETIWDDFRNYQANKEKEELENKQDDSVPSLEVIMNDHDYCVVPKPEEKEEVVQKEEEEEEKTDGVQMSVDHDYCFGQKENVEDAKEKSPKKSSSSGSSSDSDSSSCTCGSNCSCSSTSGSSSSSSDSSESDSSSSEGRRRQQARRERRKQKMKNKTKENETVDVVATDNQPVVPLDVPVQESDLETTESDTDEDFYDKQPQKLANKLLAEKKNQLLQMAAIGPYINGSIMDGSRPPTPNLPEEAKPKKKSKNKKRKKKSKNSKYQMENPSTDIPQNYQSMAPLTLTLPKNSPTTTPQFNSPNSNSIMTTPSVGMNSINMTEHDSSLRASKRRRVPNKFYGYSSDEEHEKIPQPPVLKWRKVDLPSPRSPMVVPPLTIKTMPPQTPQVDAIASRGVTSSGESRAQHARLLQQMRPPVVPKMRPPVHEQESATDSNDSSSDEEQPTQPPQTKEQPALYCYCRCPYDEVSEMIGCDASDCAIEWFHFECVGIMVPPKGQWFCPDCRKKKQQRREALQNQL